MTGQARKPRSKKVTPAFLAVQTFTDQGPALRKVLGTREEWLHQAAQDWILFQFAEAIQRKDQDEIASIVAAHPGEHVNLAKCFEAAQSRYEGLVEVLDTAIIRLMCGMARLEMAEAKPRRTAGARPERPA